MTRAAGVTDAAGFDVLMPMHLRVGADGRVIHAGPTLRRIAGDRPVAGRALFDVVEFRRPRGIADMAGLWRRAGQPLVLHWRGPCRTQFKGVAVPADREGGLILNLSFGIALVDAIRDHDLKAGDFAPTDLAVEMLYVLEAKATILDEWRKLNGRLHSARLAAEAQAYTDTLTGLGNRRAMDHVLERLVADGQAFGLVHLDLDFFKAVNDTLGHAAGDHVLQVAAQAMSDVTRAEDTLVRAGGDEFLLILPGQVDGARLRDLSERLIARLQQPIPFAGEMCRISGSAGIAVSHGGDMTVPVILARADEALYAAKAAGRGRAVVYGDRRVAPAMAGAAGQALPRPDPAGTA
ncbi:diguanylate cyclase domain-containing protein [Meridianimarinicoccus sp. RP-17]|uniref:GGDEF domain-containing protein n=1 Tax=Meridianimarinicoccus zhengii TaxID=2056810 RepID=UPI001F45B4C2|nr:GGDEF domain-containing protein [Phycocomes zhengii]